MSTDGRALVTGAVLYLTTQDVRTPVVTLTKVGVVLMVIGRLEILVTAARMAWQAVHDRR